MVIQGRVKEYDSFVRKILRKDIDNPEEINDLLGLYALYFLIPKR